jgi:hypothetical protein
MKRVVGLLFVVVLLCGFASVAQATIQISYSIDGGAPVLCGPSAGPGVLCANVASPFAISFLGASSNSPGEPGISEETSAVVRLKNVTGVAHGIIIQVGADGFVMPTAPPDIQFLSHIGGTVVTAAGVDALTFKSCIFLGSSLTPCIGGFSTPTGSPFIGGVGSFNNDQNGTISLLPAPYSIGQEIALILGAGAEVNFSASTSLTQTQVPEPASIALLGAVVLFAGRLVRRKRLS